MNIQQIRKLTKQKFETRTVFALQRARSAIHSAADLGNDWVDIHMGKNEYSAFQAIQSILEKEGYSISCTEKASKTNWGYSDTDYVYVVLISW